MTFPEHTEQIYGADAAIPSPFTKASYRMAFRRFLRYLDMEYKQAELLKQDHKIIESQIIGYIHFLTEKKHYGRHSLATPLSSIFHFYEMNDILLNKRKITRFIPQDDSDTESDNAATEKDRAYTHEEIQQILQSLDYRSEVMILLMASTGMRLGALVGLKIGHLTRIKEYNLYKILVYAASRKNRYYTFCTPECARAIDSYLEFRRRFGDPLKPTEALIREQFDIRDEFAGQNPRSLTHRTYEHIVNGILRKSGLHLREVARTHGFRKFAITQMIKAKLEYSTREFLVGHRVSRGLDYNYDRTTIEDRLQEYLKAVDLLTINPENRLRLQISQMQSEHSEEWNQLKQEMIGLKEILGRLNQKA
jgi:integrase